MCPHKPFPIKADETLAKLVMADRRRQKMACPASNTRAEEPFLREMAAT